MSYTQWYNVKELERLADEFNMVVSSDYSDRLKLTPKLIELSDPDVNPSAIESYCGLPGYTDSAVIMVGSVDELLRFLQGWAACDRYVQLGLGFNRKKAQDRRVKRDQINRTMERLKYKSKEDDEDDLPF